MSTTITINARHVSHSFTTGKVVQPVVKEVDLQIAAGELTLIIGPSGSGKSTLLAILSGLLRPQSGQVFINGQDITQYHDRDLEKFRLHHCGFVFQGFNLFGALNALQNVMLPLTYGEQLSQQAAKERASATLDAVGLSNRKTLYPAELSGGEKQRVAIARALVKHGQFLFADEPTSALDKHNGQIVIDTLRHIAHQQGSTVVAVSHDNRLIEHADRVITIEDGRITHDSGSSLHGVSLT
ncbi:MULTISPECIES: ABC transporter ATP-binding protein [Dickeya]|uniref:ABC transporter ATP-binding protein n=1 Tax=Dickeya TaxID=204037 RepID=UPI0003A6CA61|nr:MULTISPECIES: ABC transporter ATP-binding protein [Dickeya]UGA52366.1 ABC transporter ATP-binding protein [Dickeya fangzhongdai]UWH08711.1 ABC transporter ATP-binding protein [Dickeya fangzhongdai]WES87404.1 ABC transporter ATP-binding protein [Dickeya fangzhongdai]